MSTRVEADQGWVAEDMEILAKWMGWEVVHLGAVAYAVLPNEGRFYLHSNNGSRSKFAAEWEPFMNVAHDYMVLERAREVWADQREEIIMDDALRAWGADMPFHVRLRYRVGDYARAVLAVLRGSQEAPDATS